MNEQKMYDADYRYTPDALGLDAEVSRALDAIFKKYRARGYSPRDIESIMLNTVHDLTLDAVMQKK